MYKGRLLTSKAKLSCNFSNRTPFLLIQLGDNGISRMRNNCAENTRCNQQWINYDRRITIFTTTTILRPFVRDYPGEPVPQETLTTHHPDHILIFISFFHLPRSIASSLFKLRAWQSFCTTSVHVLFGLPLGLELSTSYSIHFFTQSVSSFRNTCPYHHNLFCGSINIISSIPSLSLKSLLGTLSFTLTLHIHLTILISTRWSATSFSFLTGQVSLPCSILLRTQLLYSLPLYQWYIPIGKQWHQLPEFIPSNSDSGLHSCISISIHTQYVT